MNHMDGGSHRWMGGGLNSGMGIWMVIGVLMAVLLVVLIVKVSKNNRGPQARWAISF